MTQEQNDQGAAALLRALIDMGASWDEALRVAGSLHTVIREDVAEEEKDRALAVLKAGPPTPESPHAP